ncbi:MAG: transglycosylase SLT domain-containing protein [Candidatus Eisenbacteria bacterium]
MRKTVVGMVLIWTWLAFENLALASTSHPWPARAVPFQAMIERAAGLYDVPAPVIVTFMKLESNFRPRSYNPEGVRAMKSWACDVAGDSARWGRCPDYEDALEVCRRLRDGASKSDVLRLWTFGSTGLLQVSAIAARMLGGMPYNAPNSRLFDPAYNIDKGTRIIAAKAQRLFPLVPHLSVQQWSRVRASYVGGHGIIAQNPNKADRIAARFLAMYTTLWG